jgi:hypothetical protein
MSPELKLPLGPAEDIRYEMACILKKVCPLKPCLTRRERRALRDLQY